MMSKKAWIIFAVVCVGLLGALVYVSSKDKIDVSSVDEQKIQPAATVSGSIADHVYGNAKSKVTLIEYGDFQCPACGNAHSIVKSVVEQNKDTIAFVFRNFPITTIHPNARAASAAAEAAGLQGKYWEMHDRIYENQDDWSTDSIADRTTTFTDYAKTLGLDTSRFATDLAGDKVNQKISFDQALAGKINVSATPSFYLNGKPVDSSIWSDAAKLNELIVETVANTK